MCIPICSSSSAAFLPKFHLGFSLLPPFPPSLIRHLQGFLLSLIAPFVPFLACFLTVLKLGWAPLQFVLPPASFGRRFECRFLGHHAASVGSRRNPHRSFLFPRCFLFFTTWAFFPCAVFSSSIPARFGSAFSCLGLSLSGVSSMKQLSSPAINFKFKVRLNF